MGSFAVSVCFNMQVNMAIGAEVLRIKLAGISIVVRYIVLTAKCLHFSRAEMRRSCHVNYHQIILNLTVQLRTYSILYMFF